MSTHRARNSRTLRMKSRIMVAATAVGALTIATPAVGEAQPAPQNGLGSSANGGANGGLSGLGSSIGGNGDAGFGSAAGPGGANGGVDAGSAGNLDLANLAQTALGSLANLGTGSLGGGIDAGSVTDAMPELGVGSLGEADAGSLGDTGSDSGAGSAGAAPGAGSLELGLGVIGDLTAGSAGEVGGGSADTGSDASGSGDAGSLADLGSGSGNLDLAALAQLALGSSGDGGVDLGSLADLALGSLGLPAGSAEPTLDLGSLAELASGSVDLPAGSGDLAAGSGDLDPGSLGEAALGSLALPFGSLALPVVGSAAALGSTGDAGSTGVPTWVVRTSVVWWISGAWRTWVRVARGASIPVAATPVVASWFRVVAIWIWAASRTSRWGAWIRVVRTRGVLRSWIRAAWVRRRWGVWRFRSGVWLCRLSVVRRRSGPQGMRGAPVVPIWVVRTSVVWWISGAWLTWVRAAIPVATPAAWRPVAVS
ncbi:hypothetical protein GS940_21775 [Rhodococcus hoagii]|nr:hypothetical protein [Prescottella equi]